GTTNVTVTGNVRLAPRDSTKTGGGFDGTASTTGQVSLLGNLASTSLAAAQPIMGATGTNTLVLAGSSASTLSLITSATSFTGSKLKLANTGGVVLAGSGLTYTIGSGGNIELTSQNAVTGGNTLALASGAALSRTTGRVVGRLKKPIATGPATASFEIGTPTDYTPVTLAFGSVTTPGNVALTTTSAEHPAVATSGLNAAKSVNRFFTVANEGAAFDSASVLMNFVPGDVDAGANPDSFVVRKFDAPNWTPLRAGPNTATSIQGNGATSFSDFAVGEQLYFTFTPTAGAHGTIDPPAAVLAPYGGGRTFTITPDVGYHTLDVVVDGSSVGAVPTYTFTNVTANHTISATFAINIYTITASSG